MSMHWQRVEIPISPTRQFMPMSANPVLARSPILGSTTAPIGSFYHWMDDDKAVGWRNAAVSAKNAKSIVGMVTAITAFYNCLNVPWYLHRAARELYWTWISGQPQYSNMFSVSQNSCPGWYRPGNELPIVTDASGGIIPKLARRFYKMKRQDVSENELVQTAGVGMGIFEFAQRTDTDGLRASRFTTAWYLDSGLVNKSFIAGSFQDTWGAWRARVCTDESPLALPHVHCEVGYPGEGFDVKSNTTSLPSPLPGNQDSATAFRGDFFRIGFESMKMSLGTDHYFQWLSDWTDLLSAQTTREIVTSAREMAMYFNQRYLSRSQSAVNTILNAPGGQYADSVRRDPAIATAEAAIMGAGAALASVTYGISALVASAAVLFTEIGIAASGPNFGQIRSARDDLGRWKPMLERPWLGGDPSSGSTDGVPTHTVPDPPAGALNTSLLFALAPLRTIRLGTPDVPILLSTTGNTPHLPPTVEKTGMSDGAKFAVGLAAVAALAKITGVF